MKTVRREKVAKWSLVLFDIDGNTAKVRSAKLSSATKSTKVNLVLGTKSLEVEVLEIAETEEELDLYEDEWEKTHRAIAIDREIARRQNLDQQEYGFLAVWPEETESTAETTDEHVAEPFQPDDIEDTANSEHDTSIGADDIQEEQADPLGIAILPDQPTEFKGSKSRLVKVLYQGAGDYSQTRAVPQREPCFKGGLTLDQADIVTNQVNNYEKGVVDKQTETDSVIILSDEKDLQNILADYKPTPKTTSVSTQTDPPEIPDIRSQIIEILRVVKDIRRHIPSSQQSFSKELQDLSPFPSSDLQDLDLMEYVTGSPPSSKSTPTDSFDATALFTTMLCQAASMPSASSITGPSLEQMMTTTQQIPSSVASSSGHADQQLPTTSTTCNTDNLSQQTEQQVSTTDISVPITTVADIHIFPKKVSATPGPNSLISSQISNALQHGTTAAQNMPTSITRPRIRTLPPIDEHDIITSASDIVSTPSESMDFTSLDIDSSPGFNPTPVTLSPVLHSSPDITLPLNSTIAPLPDIAPFTEANTTPANQVSSAIHHVRQTLLQPTLPLSSNSSSTRDTIQSSVALHHFKPANVYNCYPGPIHQVKCNTDIEIDFLELRIHPDTVCKVSSNSLTDSQFIFNLAKELFTPAEMFGRNYTGQKGKQSLSPRRKHAIEHCVFDIKGPHMLKQIGSSINNGIRNMFRKK
ncbi:uncharacterized protein LOC143076797 [Mytilus galloprovincialis]|uniref:uncharacterized protein LOC143076797 n=1 Tax=Mytilus galloprovincialis TaxID=29158 RepID=UPI003F7BE4B8